jgi:small subunit ribosomal protein S20
MPITSSAKKALRASERKHVYNIRRKRIVADASKQIRDLIAAKKVAEAKKLLPAAYKALDKAAKGNTIKNNTASRKKSRLSALIKKAEGK